MVPSERASTVFSAETPLSETPDARIRRRPATRTPTVVDRIGLLLLAALGLMLLLSLTADPVSAQSGRPGAPTLDAVSAGDGALNAEWAVPSNTGSSAITAYDIRFIDSSASDKADEHWTVVEDVWVLSGELEATVRGADNGVQYDVQVRAMNSAGNGIWSSTVTGTPADHGGNRNSATAIKLQTPTPGLISSSSDTDYFRFTLSEPTGVFIYTTSYYSGFLPTTGDLRNSGGAVIKSDDGDSGMRQHGDQMFLWDSLSAGTYHVSVEAPQSGAYTLHTQLVPDGTSVDDAVDLTLGGFTGGILDTASGDEDFFRLHLTQQTDVAIRIERANEGLDPIATLTDEDGDVIAVHDDSYLEGDRNKHFIINKSLDAGVYHLKVNAAPESTYEVCRGFEPRFRFRSFVDCRETETKDAATTGGPYLIGVLEAPRSGSSRSSARPLPIDGSVITAGHLSRGGEADYYSITVDEPTRVAVQVVSDEVDTTGTYYYLGYREAPAYVKATDYVPGGHGFILYANLEAGTHQVRVNAGRSSQTGGYTVRAVEDTEYADFFDTCSAITTSYDDPLYGCQWYLNNTGQNSGVAAGSAGEDINVEDVWAGGNLGEGITIAMIDDGLEFRHEDLADNVNVSLNRDYTYGGGQFEQHYNRGTQLAGLVAGRDNAIGIRGVAPRATIVNYNALRYGFTYDIARAMVSNLEEVAVSNNSWGHIAGPGFNYSNSIWETAIKSGLSKGFDEKGIFYATYSGAGANDGDYSNLSGYANYYGVTAVCSVNDLGQRSSYSERGPNVWVCAPSSDDDEDRQGLTSTLPYNRYASGIGGSGASTALVSGVAALVRKANPELTWRDVRLVLAGSARKNHTSDSGWSTGALKYGSTTENYQFNHSYGFGVVDAKAAVDLAATWTNLPEFKSLAAVSDELNLRIEDSGTVSQELTVGPGVDFIEYIDVDIDLFHPSFRDLKIELVSPSNAVSVLSETYDGADKFSIDESFRFGTAKHLGENAAGTWTLRISDGVTDHLGTLDSWSLQIYGHGSSVRSTAIHTVIPGSESLEVSWDGTDDPDIGAYDVRHIQSDATDKADANWTVVDDAWTGTGPLEYEVTGLTNGTTYDLQVRGVGATEDGDWSDTVTGAPAAAADAVPAVTAALGQEQALGVLWSAPSNPGSPTTAYDVRYIRSDATSKADADWTLVDDAQNDLDGSLAYAITGLSDDVVYDVQVRAVSSDGDSAWSATAKGLPREVGNDPGTAAPLVFDIPYQAAMDFSNDIDVYRIDLSEETEVYLYTEGTTDTIAELFDADGDFIRSNDDSGPSFNFAIQETLQPGAYFLEVTGWRGTTGDYQLWMLMPEEEQDIGDALTLDLGSSIDANITLADVDYYKLVLTEETEVLLYSSGDTDTVADLLDADENRVEYNDDGYLPFGIRNFTIRRTLAAGTYFLKVEGYFNEIGDYTVHAKAVTAPGGTSTDALSLTLNSPEGGTVDPAGDADYYTFTLASADYVEISAVSDSGVFDAPDVKGELLDASLDSLEAYFTNAYYREAFAIYDYLPAGTYYLKITGVTDTVTESYTVMVSDDTHVRELTEMCEGIFPEVSDPLYGCQWYLRSEGQLPALADSDMNIGNVWDDYTGDGITVAVVDTGMDFRHADLRGDKVDETKNHSYRDDGGVEDFSPSHGTSVAGLIAGRANDIGMRGVAPDATIYAYNLLRRFNEMNEADALSRHSDTTAVYNNSWGVPDFYAGPGAASSLIKLAIEDGVINGYGGKGAFYAWAAGNGHNLGDYSTLEEYSNLFGVTAVCAVNSYGKRSTYSEMGSNLWVCGSSNGGGRGILTTTSGNSFTQFFGGTSAASPLVAGVAALVRDANDALTWRDVKLILAATAQKVDPDNLGWETGALKYGSTSDRYDFNHEYGFGLVDAEAAVEAAENWTLLPKFRRFTVASSAGEQAIPDRPLQGSPTFAEFTLTVGPYVDFIEHVQIDAHIAHESFRELQIELVSPSGAVSVLSPYYPPDGPRFFGFPEARWDAPFEFSSTKHLGEDGAGEWTLRIADYYTGKAGTLKSWSITLYGHGDSPEIPAIDSATAGVRSATIAWSAPDDPNNAITSYDLRYADGGNTELAEDDWTIVESIWTSGTLSYTLTGLAADVEHWVQIRAVSNAGPGPWSEEEKVFVNLAAPTAVTIDEVRTGDRSLGIFWQPPSEALGDEITAYDIRYILTSEDETVDGNWTVRSNVWSSGPLQYNLTSLTNDSEYDVQVRAVNSADRGAWSTTSTGTPVDQVNVSLSWDVSSATYIESEGRVVLKAVMVTTEDGALPSSFSVDVDVSASGAALDPEDYSLGTQTLTFSAGDFIAVTVGSDDRWRAELDVVVTIRDDGVIEADENFTLTLSYDTLVQSHLRGNSAALTVTITDDDHVPVTLSWVQSLVSVDEGSGRVRLTAVAETTANTAPKAGFAFQALVSAVQGSATKGDDYPVAFGRVIFPRTSFIRTTIDGLSRYRARIQIEVPITDDTLDEPDETLTLVLSHANPSLRYAVGQPSSVDVVIRDDDYGPVSLSWEQTSFTLDEDDGSVTLTAHLTTETSLMPETAMTVNVRVSTSGISAAAGSDFSGLNNTARFRVGDFTQQTVNGQPRYRASKDFTVNLINDTDDEPDEEFRVTLSFTNPSLPHLVGGSKDAFVTIIDNDHVPVTLGWEETAFTAEEPTSPSDTTPVTLTAQAITTVDKRPESGFTFDYTVNTQNGSARQPDDYEQLSTSGTFNRSDFSRTQVDGHFRYIASTSFTVQVEHDTVNEPNESFTVRLAYDGSSQPHLQTGDTTATVTLTDDIASLTDLSASVSGGPGDVERGDQITYDWSVSNSGPSASTSTRLTGTLDAGSSFVSATPSGQCNGSGSRVTCNLGTLEVGESANGAVVVEVKDAAAGDLDFSASFSSDQLDRTPSDNSDSVHSELLAPPEDITTLNAAPTTEYIDISWTPPKDNGSEVTGYEMERKAADGEFVPIFPPPVPGEISFRDDDVEQDVEYTYRIRAINNDGTAKWSIEIIAKLGVPPPPPIITTGGGGGGFGPAPVAPKFGDGFRTTRSLAQNARPGGAVGDPVLATHPDDFEITYSLSGTDAALFTVDEETGQIRVKEGTTLELGRTYTVNLTATDSAGFGAIIIVAITVEEAAHHAYDLNANGRIDREEVVAAVRDYFAGLIEKEDVVELIKLYFAA